ncbi:uncharacterized protein LOC103163979 isoform X2 [Cricetulus griseus]|uniref:Uncharacterized protein LOC103163979 isoform X2 n=1 Tax=Cricetulus griseus TaxID=10029 RepID=A0A9J7GV29_CRIGR|nr:uncharacterized protein LOC103163979 isoform X2 [Cricetulus griseus]XP_035296487.1 uncharacterized protein LOC103163979 isoform X2 [Cricetulus griseus]
MSSLYHLRVLTSKDSTRCSLMFLNQHRDPKYISLDHPLKGNTCFWQPNFSNRKSSISQLYLILWYGHCLINHLREPISCRNHLEGPVFFTIHQQGLTFESCFTSEGLYRPWVLGHRQNFLHGDCNTCESCQIKHARKRHKLPSSRQHRDLV